MFGDEGLVLGQYACDYIQFASIVYGFVTSLTEYH